MTTVTKLSNVKDTELNGPQDIQSSKTQQKNQENQENNDYEVYSDIYKTKINAPAHDLKNKIRFIKTFEQVDQLNIDTESIVKKEIEHKPDTIVTSVINKFIERSKMGKDKYGTDLDRTDLSLYDWILHAQEEHMDAILYLEKIKKLIK
uniref:Uncharacterized protein n=1 Tax=viral metagenome TaxID=1070528 RepID=A0A6C0I6H9_9ZZZZ